MRASRRRSWALASTLTAAAIVTAACGTTVPGSQVEQAQAGSSDLVAGGVPNAASSAAVGPGADSSTGSGPVGGTSGGGPATATTRGGTTGVAVGPSLPPASGASALSPLKIGALTATGAG